MSKKKSKLINYNDVMTNRSRKKCRNIEYIESVNVYIDYMQISSRKQTV